jgi:transposase
MELLHERCAGLDVHKNMIQACARIAGRPKATTELARFGTTTGELLRLLDWLVERGVTHVVMEATGVYWKPVWHVLADHVELVLANAQHVKAVPGRKSDVNDATWLAELLAHGLVRGSFVAPQAQQELRDLTRTRKQLTREVSRHTQRIQKVLEDANIKLSSVVSDVLGEGSIRILRAIIAGETDAAKLTELRGKIRAPAEELHAALRGRITEHHRFMLRLHLDQIDTVDKGIAEIERRIEQLLAPFREQVERLTTIPGVSRTIAHVIVAEIGLDMSRFPTHRHLLSWAGLCPRQDESAGKARSTRIRHGNPWLKTDLCQAALAGSRKKGTYLEAQFHRIRSRRGVQKAIVAVAASILTAAYHMLLHGVAYRDLTPAHFDRRDSSKALRRLTRRIEALGYKVEIKAA